MSALYVRVWHRLNRETALYNLPPWYHARVQDFCALKLLASRLDVGGL